MYQKLHYHYDIDLIYNIYGFNLYTGKVGYIAYNFKDVNYIGLVILILVFNLITTYLLGIVCAYAFPAIVEPAKKIYEAKLAAPLLRLLITGIFCGLLMFLAVDTWKKGSPFGCFIYIPVFIISGFDHSIANMFYFGVSGIINMESIFYIFVVIIGNAIGGMAMPLLNILGKEDPKNA